MTSIQQQLDTIAELLPKALLIDRMAGRRELNRIRQAMKKLAARNQAAQNKSSVAKLHTRCRNLARRLRDSASIRSNRMNQRLDLQFDPELPISAKKDELIEAIRRYQVLIVAGETGSGKSTQLPKLCLAAGRGVDGRIGVTQPRRIAAMTVGSRIAEELGESIGHRVAYQIRFKDTATEHTRIKLMTDGILLAETHADPYLNQYDTLIVDEAHERSLNIDFILGIVKQLLRRRKDLKLIITSATIDTAKFARAFDQSPVIEVSGRLYTVDTRHMEADEAGGEDANHIDQAVRAVDRLQGQRTRGDILIFMPTEQDIRDTCELLRGRRHPNNLVIPLFGRLSSAEQQQVFRPARERKVIVATNVAETSITIPGIHYVIDSGLARISQYTPRSRTTTLPVVPISQSSADQRAGRCGRVAKGVCIRLYSQEDYLQRPKYTPPEILRSNLADVILRMTALKLGKVDAFPFIDPPNPRSVQDGYSLLLELGAIKAARAQRGPAGRYLLTPKGRLMARLPLDPRLAGMLLEADTRDCLDDVAIIAAALSIQDPRERPLEKQAQADQVHARFADSASDFITLLNIWHRYGRTVTRRASWNQVKQFCLRHFISFRRMREWYDIYRQILAVLAAQNIRPSRAAKPPEDPSDPANSWYAAIHQCILSGFLSNIAMKKEKQIFQAAHGRQVMIFPGSGLFKNPGQWIVAAEMVETSRLFARGVAVIDPAWLEAVGAAQCKYTYLDPHWERKRGAVMATEQVSLYGLIVDRRPKPFGPVDPAQATDIFIRSALIDGDVRRPLPFMQHNRQLTHSIESMEDRLRRKDLLVDEQIMMAFYRERLGQVYDLRGLEAEIRKAGGDSFLHLHKEDLLNYGPDEEELAQYPDHILVGPHRIACDYRFEPGQKADGVTAYVPAKLAGSISADAFQWVVPGLLKEKITALIKALPKALRRQLVPVNDTADMIVKEMPPERQDSLGSALSRFVHRRFGVTIPASAWNEQQLDDHLRMRIALTDEDGKIMRSSRDAAVFLSSSGTQGLPDGFPEARQAWEQGPITHWHFGDLPESVILNGPGKRQWTAYPALEDRGDQVVLTALAAPSLVGRTHARGVKALLMNLFSADIKFLRKNLQLPKQSDSHCRYFGGRQALQEKLLDRVVNDLLAQDVRTAATFDALVKRLQQDGLAGHGQVMRQSLLDVVAAYHDARSQLFELEKTHFGNAAVQAFLEDLRSMLKRLVPDTFLKIYTKDRLPHLVRYIKALTLRAQRGAVNLEKDHSKAQQIAPYIRGLEEMAQTLTARDSDDKRQAVEELFWMLEEYKISIFAQEIKTARPISAKRLDRQIKTIENMA